MDLDVLKYSSSLAWASILTWSLLGLSFRSCQAVPGGSSGERVHIRLHMPEVVRQHTHFHNVYKYPKKYPQHTGPAPAPAPAPAPTLTHPKLVGKPHVQLLGYTTAAGGTGPMSPSLMQLMATAVAPTNMPPASAPAPVHTSLAPNYGPALFDSFNEELQKQEAPLSATTTARPIAKKQQLLQQIFTPNVMSALQQEAGEETDSSLEEDRFEKNSLLNLNFLEALQREYLSKFGGRRKRKKSAIRFGTRPKDYYPVAPLKPRPYYYQGNQEEDDPAEHFEDYSDEPQDDYEEVMMMSHEGRGRSRGRHSNPTSYMESSSYYPPETDLDDAQGYDSAVAFSGQDNSISAMPTVDDFLDDANNHPSSGYGNFYDPYSSHEMASQPSPWQPSPTTASTSAGMANSWTARPTAPASSQPSKGIRLRPRSPGGRANKVRYVKLVTRKKRRNRERIRTKRYRP
ncbi:uncharacterized protein [Drosophila pseudoobscura]|uniref:Uncharacterized protein n=1 Tax=Drosophila pseudoobscura pseudoobscura TaxID=46245 RepID=A0A6I8URD1_DROPS|nr:uncharacterized protein LOC4802727 [Drosophila pseudoobscura]